MERINANQWAFVSDLDYPETLKKLCIEAWLDLTAKSTIDSYRIRAMNLRTLVIEFADAVDLFRREVSPTHHHVELIAEELLHVISREDGYDKDRLNLSRLSQSVMKIRDMLKGRPKDWERAVDPHLLTIRLYQDRLNREYRGRLTESLIELSSLSLSGSSSAGHAKPDEWRHLLWTLSSLLTDYVAEGISPQHLHDQRASLLGEQDPASSNFETRVRSVLKDLNTPKQWNVYFAVDDLPPSILDGSSPFDGISFQRTGSPKVKQALGENESLVYAKLRVKAPDRPSAAVRARQQLDGFLDVYALDHRGRYISISPTAYVVRPNHVEDSGVETSVLFGDTYSSSMSWEPDLSQLTRGLLKARHVTNATKARLRNAIRNFRMATLASSPETAYLHMWVAFEALATGNSTKVPGVIPALAQLMGMDYIHTLLVDFILQLNKLGLYHLTFSLVANTSVERTALLLEVFRDSSRLDMLRNQLVDSPLMQYRLEELIAALSSSKATADFVRRHVNRVQWHMFRLYRVRNAIMHEAAQVNVAGYIYSLDTYTFTFLGQLAERMIGNACYYTIEDFLERCKCLYDEYLRRLEEPNTTLTALETIEPWRLEI